MKVYQKRITEEFIKDAYEAADDKWKAKIKYLVPEAFKINFEVGNWYKLKEDSQHISKPKVLVNYRGGEHGFGFNASGLWDELSSWSFMCYPEVWKPATNKEVKQALIKEAKKRGFINIELLTIKCLNGNIVERDNFTSVDNEFHFYNNILTLDGVRIFENGNWAEILDAVTPPLEETEEIKTEPQKSYNMEERLKNYKTVQYLRKLVAEQRGQHLAFHLIGGAVIDIIDRRKPKDFDIVTPYPEIMKEYLRKGGFKFISDSKTASTFIKEDIVVQVLKTEAKNFDFTISQSSINLSNLSCSLNELEIENKLLVPVNYDDPKAILNSLSRIPHWRKKGYRVDDVTYFSMLNSLKKSYFNNQEDSEVGELPFHS